MRTYIRLFVVVALFITLSTLATAQPENYFNSIAGNWEGTLEYQDYSNGKRVKLKTYLSISPGPDGVSAEFATVYDDFGRIIKRNEKVRIDAVAKRYISGETVYAIESFDGGRLVLLGQGQDGERIEPSRTTITFEPGSLVFLKETRTPWQFRNQLTLKRADRPALEHRSYSPEQVKRDLSVLKETLAAIHPGLYRYQTESTFDRLFENELANVKGPMSENELYLRIARLVSQIRCGHTYLNPYNQNSLLRERIFNGRNYIPFYFRIVDRKIIVTETAADGISPGTEVRRINGIESSRIIDRLLEVASADGANSSSNRLSQIQLTRFAAERYALFDWYFPLIFPLDRPSFTIDAVEASSRKRRTIDVPALTKEERTAAIETRYGKAPTYDDGWKFEIRPDSIGCLKIGNSITWRLKQVKFKDFIAEAFARLRAAGTKHLVIDLRGNDGGDMNVGYELARHLANRELPPYAESRRFVRNVAARPGLLEYLDTYSEELKSNLQQGLSREIYRASAEGYFEVLPNKNVTTFRRVSAAENSFRGETYIISDGSNGSASFQFLAYVKEQRLAQIVGQASGGNLQGINGGNYFFLSLPNSRIEIDIPVYFIAPLTPQNDSPVLPDFHVAQRPDDIATGRDAEMEFVISRIRRTGKR